MEADFNKKHYEFREWAEEHDVRLLPWQEVVVSLFFAQPIASGKSYLLQVLLKYDDERGI